MNRNIVLHLVLLIVMGISACAPVPEPTATEAQSAPTTEAAPFTPTSEDTATSEPDPTETESAITESIPVTGHLMTPAGNPPPRVKLTYDVESAGTSAPYGDSYRINRFERPFRQDMTYIPALDILRFEVSADTEWYYVSIMLNGSDPNNDIGIQYGVEIDKDADGFGDALVWASPPYATDWTTTNVQVYEDSDQDTAGLSSSQADPGFEGNGYDSQVFDGKSNENEDPDLAWVRLVEGGQAIIQFAFKKSLAGASFVIGVIADAGLKDVSQFDYNDRFEASQAGSPLRNDPNYPLGPLYAVDNTCWQPYNLELVSYPPKFCPPEALPAATRPRTLQTVPVPATTQPSSGGITPPASTEPPTNPPTDPPTQPPTDPPTQPPTQPPTDPPTQPPTQPPTDPPTQPPPAACTPTFDPGICDEYDPEICDCVQQ